MVVRIKRHPAGREEFNVDMEPKATLLELLIKLKEEEDPTLTFRSMCRAGICGTCAVKVNGKPVLACSVRVENLGEELFIEPLEGYRIIKDLAVEHETIYERLRLAKVWLMPAQEYEVLPHHLERVSRSHECILCGICDSVCPVLQTGSSFGGPLVLTRLYKHLYDPRNIKQDLENLFGLNPQLCTHCMNCSYACPKRLMPEAHIREEELLLVDKGLLRKESGGFEFLGF